MRKLTFGGAISLDLYLARPDGSIDWLIWGDEAAAMMAESWKTTDTILMGRKTYEASLALGGGPDLPGTRTYVFSRTLAPGPAGGVTIVGEDVVAFVRDLKAREGRDVVLMGGGELARPLFEAELVDELGFNVHPILLGAGVPALVPMARQVDLELAECRPCKNGCVLVLYRVKR
jgi:dihydrofolate reductase